jgi:hypothetical protein
VNESLLNSQTSWLTKAFAFLDIITLGGNRIAGFRLRGLRKLEEMLDGDLIQRAQSMDRLSKNNIGSGSFTS